MKLSAPFFVLAAASATAVLAAPPTRAVAVLRPTAGNSVEGQVTFSKADGGVKVSGHLTGLTPGKHGFHIHEFGDCTATDGSSAGGHFNPAGAQHGAPTDAMRHEGDLGNVDANDKGVADLDYVDTHASFEGDASILGRGVIVHAAPDDFKTQPTGNAGARVACGVIGAAKAQ